MAKATGFTVASLTVENALAGSIHQTGARQHVRDLQGKQVKAEQMVMWAATLTTLSARKQDLIGTGSAQTKQGEFIASMGLSKSYGTLLMNLSRALEHGISRDSRVWSFLNTAKGKSGAVSTVLKVEPTEANSAKVRSQLAQWAEDPSKVPAKSTDGRPNDGTDQGDKVETDPAPEQAPARREMTVSEIVTHVIALLPEMPEADFLRLYSAIDALADTRTVGVPVAAEVG